MALDLKQDVFLPVVARVRKQSDSLRSIKRFPRSGIEGWFKVEIVAALSDKVTSVNNKGPDLTLQDGSSVEIKAATNFERNYCIGPIKKYGTPSLFLADGSNPSNRARLENNGDVDLVGLEDISDGESNWLVGMVKPRS